MIERVSGYTRQQHGRTVHVSAYTRSPRDMSLEDIAAEILTLSGGNPDVSPEDSIPDPYQRRARMILLAREIAGRKRREALPHERRGHAPVDLLNPGSDTSEDRLANFRGDIPVFGPRAAELLADELELSAHGDAVSQLIRLVQG